MRRALLAVAFIGLCAGLANQYLGVVVVRPTVIWTASTVPVVTVLAFSILRDLWAGRFGVDAIALVSMSAALALGEPLAGVVVAIMYAGGTVLEDFARGRAERDLTALTDRSPRLAHRRLDGALETIAVDEVAVGDELLVRAGELVPVDGILADAAASVDESAVTGEPLPERRIEGDRLRSGTINAGEAFVMRASAIATQSTYAAIVNMVAAAQTAKTPFIRMADRFAMVMLPATLILAGLAWHFSGDPIRALAVLVVATPCPLILAAPVAFIGGVARAARAGILMKGSAALEALAEARTAVFDKTGTLTYGGADLIEVETAPGRDPDKALRLLASLEQASHHILAENIVAVARKKGLALSNPSDVQEYRGSGLTGVVDGTLVRAGSRSLVLDRKPLPLWAEPGELRYRGQPVLRVFVALDGRLAAVLTFGDALRADARTALDDLRSAGLSRFVMLTGDDAATATRVATAAGIDTVVADASAADKVATVEAENALAATMMVGDGINDAPALATATVGVAMGARGATASSQAADVIILTNRLQPVADAVWIARRTRSIARQSIIVGLALSGAAMIAAAFGLITPVAGALLQEGIDIAVILNALRALGGGTVPSHTTPASAGSAKAKRWSPPK
ncbi:heavy metal translocating P-type ATPase [Oryzicola mucosus]|uniref:P-type Zn(2+) transporter n=1 Tax=Oryzicola mucosus TaxID=2767425 RepID=A0A8J6U9D8_9HYPH|nr:heavy metal translocating P-type ATPase [Oryzicola mucosus]MBD0417072.1 heavy metal translocating P-type ATPase [Oryzicola mucosus]